MLLCRNAEGLRGQRKVANPWYKLHGLLRTSSGHAKTQYPYKVTYCHVMSVSSWVFRCEETVISLRKCTEKTCNMVDSIFIRLRCVRGTEVNETRAE